MHAKLAVRILANSFATGHIYVLTMSIHDASDAWKASEFATFVYRPFTYGKLTQKLSQECRHRFPVGNSDPDYSL